jgi:ketosteroid isomerase-like protein
MQSLEASVPLLSLNDSDLRAIEQLNQQDIDAVMAGDVATITSQWTEDFVVLPSAGPIVRGRTANVAIAERSRVQIEAMDPLEYRVECEEIKVLGEYAYEWGTYSGSTRLRASGAGDLLQREADAHSPETGGWIVENASHNDQRRSACGVVFRTTRRRAPSMPRRTRSSRRAQLRLN